MMSIALIGAGKVGVSISSYLESRAGCKVSFVVAHSPISSERAKRYFPTAVVCADVSQIGEVDAVLIATPDDVIAGVAKRLWDSGKINDRTVVFHLSGALTSEVLKQPGESKGSFASIHPSKSFPSICTDPESFKGTLCAIEGDQRAVAFLKGVFENLEAELITIDPKLKAHYHLASVFSHNFTNILGQLSCELFSNAGLDKALSYKLWRNLAASALENADLIGLKESLTGPIKRGDEKTMLIHREILLNVEPELEKLYCDFVKVTKSRI